MEQAIDTGHSHLLTNSYMFTIHDHLPSHWMAWVKITFRDRERVYVLCVCARMWGMGFGRRDLPMSWDFSSCFSNLYSTPDRLIRPFERYLPIQDTTRTRITTSALSGIRTHDSNTPADNIQAERVLAFDQAAATTQHMPGIFRRTRN
jgi:hypothetical protein